MRILAMGVLLCLAANTFGEEKSTPFTGDRSAEEALRATVRVNVNPQAPYRASGVIVEIDRKVYPKLLRENEVPILTAAHVAARLGWTREVTVECIDFAGTTDARTIAFSEPFVARLVALPQENGPDIALLAAAIPRKLFDDGKYRVARVAPTAYPFRLEEQLQLVGCPRGALPTLANAYPGQLSGDAKRPFLSVSFTPVEGQ